MCIQQWEDHTSEAQKRSTKHVIITTVIILIVEIPQKKKRKKERTSVLQQAYPAVLQPAVYT
jgi:hypothetical protein